MRTWLITYDSKTCRPALISAHEQQDTPALKFSLGDKVFSVEFRNRSDYFAARHGATAEVIIASANRKKLVIGKAVNEKREPSQSSPSLTLPPSGFGNGQFISDNK